MYAFGAPAPTVLSGISTREFWSTGVSAVVAPASVRFSVSIWNDGVRFCRPMAVSSGSVSGCVRSDQRVVERRILRQRRLAVDDGRLRAGVVRIGARDARAATLGRFLGDAVQRLERRQLERLIRRLGGRDVLGLVADGALLAIEANEVVDHRGAVALAGDRERRELRRVVGECG